ncbi:phosphatase PAP2 family protein [Natronosporangium hydrolyticum]|uniref:Phosphatase PAP2 family protein n=1 Tax=Natronosporangium hydrolyticum TaxID=2811111 RepID=A0A895Y9F7_9ACTN|nr:phosphatase PAP2 family protein [Natronosporangium hydrolyticum]QSB14377.1 phosphatase PAP2 family protein [Natronosporangium hydrolyticum]
MQRDTSLATRQVPRDAILATAAAAGFVAITAALAVGGPLLELDLLVREWSEAHRPDWADTLARVFNRIGQGAWLMIISGLLAAWLGWRRRTAGAPWRVVGQPLLYGVCTAVMIVPTVLLIKAITHRAAPSSDLPPEQTVELFGSLPAGEYAAGYPGGHVLNTVVWYGVIVALITAVLREYGRGDPPLSVRLAIRLVPFAIVLFTTTYLSFHWLTDGLAGLALGLAIDRLLAVLRPYLWPTVP